MTELFDGIDLSLPDEQLSEWLHFVIRHRVGVDQAGNQLPTPGNDEIDLLQQWSREAGPKTRRVAVQFLIDHGPCSWEDLETWALDVDQDVRYPVVSGPIFDPVEAMILADKARWVRLLSRAAERYPDDYQPAFALFDLTRKNRETLDLTWDVAESLLNIGDPELYTMLEVSYFEHVIPDLGLGPDDKHIRRWLSGSDGTRQRMLLGIAAYWGLDSGKMREIVEALTHARDKHIASIAEGVLAGRVKYGDIN